ncbi:hypothetical protein [Fundidesulfovibrio putealis]|uniref:hypothetical protein n=1 Tax=Fundidesulfovibrio putealis TaxID=270496 RepID=UPI0012EC1821|nr:hypothetical protein [Fundidesulfovibrio putealis]
MIRTSEPFAHQFLRACRLSRLGRSAEARDAYVGLARLVRIASNRGSTKAFELAVRLEETAPTSPLENLCEMAAHLLEIQAREGVCPERLSKPKHSEEIRAIFVARLFSSLTMGGIALVAVLTFALFFTQTRKLERTHQALAELGGFLAEAKAVGHRPLKDISGNTCTECPCKERGLLGNLPEGDICRSNWRMALDKAYAVLHGRKTIDWTGFDHLPSDWKRDAWGAPYLLNENEGEGGPEDCTKDQLRSAGPDGLPGTADDLILDLPSELCKEGKS